LVVERRDHDVRPVAAAVLAHAPAAVLEAPVEGRGAQLLRGAPGGDVLRRVEALEGLADDLLGLVADDALRARVPARHATAGIEHEDGVILDAFEEQAKALLALAQPLLLRAALAQVARDLGEAAMDSLAVPQRRDHHARPEARAVLAQAPALVLEASGAQRLVELVRRPVAVERLL